MIQAVSSLSTLTAEAVVATTIVRKDFIARAGAVMLSTQHQHLSGIVVSDQETLHPHLLPNQNIPHLHYVPVLEIIVTDLLDRFHFRFSKLVVSG